MRSYNCMICGWIYDPQTGDPDSGIAAGTALRISEKGMPVCG
jgi:rubredoxin